MNIYLKFGAKKKKQYFILDLKTSSQELKHHPDIEMLDFNTGFQQLEAYQGKKPAIPAVVLTADWFLHYIPKE